VASAPDQSLGERTVAVDVTIDQSGHDRPARRVDDARVEGALQSGRPDREDDIPIDEDISGNGRTSPRIDEAPVADKVKGSAMG